LSRHCGVTRVLACYALMPGKSTESTTISNRVLATIFVISACSSAEPRSHPASAEEAFFPLPHSTKRGYIEHIDEDCLCSSVPKEHVNVSKNHFLLCKIWIV
jgi:hypothetical protein